MSYNVLDMMVVRVERLTWHLLDVRTPLMNLFAHIPASLSSDMPFLTEARTKVRGYLADVVLTAPPDGVPVRQHALYRGDPLPALEELEEPLAGAMPLLALDANQPLPRDRPPGDDPPQGTPYQAPDVSRMGIDYKLVLDIGVGHVHHHEQYQGVTGGEIQPLRSPTTAADVFDDPSEPYRFMNGPVKDGDGYIDGTCNFYLLVQLATADQIGEAAERNTLLRRNAYGLLYIDEQTFFAQRWHLAHPDDWRGSQGSIVARVHGDGARFNFNPGHFWCPFRAGYIGPRSRLAVAAQVALVNGEDPATGEPLLCSINFSFVSIDRTWRWRKLPAPARYFDGTSLWLPQPVSTVTGDEQVPSGTDACVYPQTLRLRDDMTICFQGRGPGPAGPAQVGRWYQRYLTGTNELVPSAGALTHQVSPVCGELMLRKRQLEHEEALLTAKQYEVVHAQPKDPEAMKAVADELAANRLAKKEVDNQWAQNSCGETLRPKEGYTHPWRFLHESAFRRADQFSHFGVYDVVDARTQYYLVTATPDDADTLATAKGGEHGPWVDASGQIRVEGYTFRFDWLRLPLTNAWTFNLLWSGLAREVLSLAGPFRHFFGTQQFAAPVSAPTELRPPRDRKLLPSMFNPETRLRVVRRGSQWIAMHWDKRDDDLIRFIPDLNPVKLEFQEGPVLKTARVTLGERHWVEEPPAARIGYFRWQPAGSSPPLAVVGFVPSRPQGWLPNVWRNVWRVRMAAFSETGAVLRLLDNATSPEFLSMSHACFEYAWKPSAAEERDLKTYCTAAGAARYGTTIWLEDVVGHVNVPDEVRWSDEKRWSDPIETLVGSYANLDRYVRRSGDKVTLTALATDVDRQEARFVIVPGLSAGRGVSFESMNARGQFLRHQGFQIKLHRFEDSDLFRADATFHRRPGLANAASVSFESVNHPGRFIRQKLSELWVEPFSGDHVLYNADATFRLLAIPTPAPSTSVPSTSVPSSSVPPSTSVGGKGSVGSTSMTSGIGAKQL